MTALEIRDVGAKTVLEAIDLTPSVFVRHQGAQSENLLSIRGQAPRLELLDGMRGRRSGVAAAGPQAAAGPYS